MRLTLDNCILLMLNALCWEILALAQKGCHLLIMNLMTPENRRKVLRGLLAAIALGLALSLIEFVALAEYRRDQEPRYVE